MAAIWRWPGGGFLAARTLIEKLLVGLVCGGALGTLALGYLWIIHQIPALDEQLAESRRQISAHPELRWWLILMSVGFAPLAEEYLFRGLLFRALDREWGGWRAAAASSLFFAIYHPPVSWIPVAAFGFMSALLFRRTGHLAPCVLAHMAYNAVVGGMS